MASAVRGTLSSTAISPKKSPFSRWERVCDSPLMCLTMSTSPSWMMNISVPSSPCWKITSPAAYTLVESFTGSFPPVVLKTVFMA